MLRLDSGVSSANIIEASEKKDFFDNRDAKMEKPVTFDEFIESTESSLIGEKISETASSTSK